MRVNCDIRLLHSAYAIQNVVSYHTIYLVQVHSVHIQASVEQYGLKFKNMD